MLLLISTIRGYHIYEILNTGTYSVETPSGETLAESFPTFQDAKREVVRRL
jgi:hypothetical protein